MVESNRVFCCRQRAGPLVKESRAIRPRLSQYDSPYERAEKNKILRPPRDSSVCRSRVDRLELLLALFGYDGWVYSLTFDDEHLPCKFRDVRRKRWRSFLRRLQFEHGGAFDYIYLIEGRHGDHRYHLHLVVHYSDFPPMVVEDLWRFGYVEGKPLLCIGRDPYDTFRRTAKYFCKERSDGITIPIDARTWVASRHLRAQLPPPEYFMADTCEIPLPEHYRVYGRNNVDNAFGHYSYLWYIEHDPYIQNSTKNSTK